MKYHIHIFNNSIEAKQAFLEMERNIIIKGALSNDIHTPKMQIDDHFDRVIHLFLGYDKFDSKKNMSPWRDALLDDKTHVTYSGNLHPEAFKSLMRYTRNF